LGRGFRDRDYLQTQDGLFFTVIGNLHPQERVLAYLKYLPHPRGRWGRPGKRYRRSMRYYCASNVMKAVEFLSRRYPEYVFHSEPFNFMLSAVPVEKITRHYQPEERLRQLHVAAGLDELERKAVELASILSEQSGVPFERLGVTGSVLVDLHSVKFSDIDLVVYGRNQSRRVKEALLSFYEGTGIGVERLRGRRLSRWCREQSTVHPFSMKEAKALYQARKWNKGVFKDTIFSVHPTKVEEEVSGQYGDELYKPCGIVEAKARVVDSEDSYFLPATYLVDNVRPQRISRLGSVERVVSFEGLYADVAENGEEIAVRGKLEDVLDASGRLKYRRILVGSPEAHGTDYVKAAVSKP